MSFILLFARYCTISIERFNKMNRSFAWYGHRVKKKSKIYIHTQVAVARRIKDKKK